METVIGIIVFIVLGAIIALVVAGNKKSAPKDYLDDRGRPRCGRCKKIYFTDGTAAQRAADTAATRGTYLRAYQDQNCSRWHLTSQQPRARRY